MNTADLPRLGSPDPRGEAGYWVFRCPVCGTVRGNDVGPWEMTCTGPSESRHDHEMALTRLIGVGYKRAHKSEVYPDEGEARAAGPLIMLDLTKLAADDPRIIRAGG
jgi:hypothetical protein